MDALYQSEDQNPTQPTPPKTKTPPNQPIKGWMDVNFKTVEDKNGESSSCNKETLTLLLIPASYEQSNTLSPRQFHSDTELGIKILHYCEIRQRGGA